MGTLTVRKVDDEVMRDLRVSAAKRGVSMEQEARDRLRLPLDRDEPKTGSTGTRWNLKASLDDVLALGRKPAEPIDQKAEADALYDYLDHEDRR